MLNSIMRNFVVIIICIILSALINLEGRDNDYGHFIKSHNSVYADIIWECDNGDRYNYDNLDFNCSKLNITELIDYYNFPDSFSINHNSDTILIYRTIETGTYPDYKDERETDLAYWSKNDSIYSKPIYNTGKSGFRVTKRNDTIYSPYYKLNPVRKRLHGNSAIEQYVLHLIENWEIEELYKIVNLTNNCLVWVDGADCEISRIIINSEACDIERIKFRDFQPLLKDLSLDKFDFSSFVQALVEIGYIDEDSCILRFIEALPQLSNKHY